MAKRVDEIQNEALKLPVQERARLAEALIASLDEDSDVKEAWAEEIHRRLEELRSGSVATVPAEDALSQVEARFGR